MVRIPIVLRRLAVLAGCTLSVVSPARGIELAKLNVVTPTPQATLLVPPANGNPYYTVHVDDCGAWTATTGPLHSATISNGAPVNVIYGNGTPGTSNTILQSYTTGTFYATGGACTSLCGVAGPAAVTPINVGGGPPEGYSLTWTFVDGGPGGNTIVFTQEVVVEVQSGPLSESNTVIRESHTVHNNGPGAFSYGLRKMWDWAIGPFAGFDDGPWFGDCESTTAACDTSMNMSGSPAYPQSYVINEDPLSAACPSPVAPKNPAGCSGSPLYLVAGTVRPPSTLVPPPDAPELLQFNAWPSLVSSCWEPGLVNNAPCSGGDTAVAYYYGRTSGLSLASGQERSFDQYVLAVEDSCPPIVLPAVSTLGMVVISLLLLTGLAIKFARRQATAVTG